MKYTIKHKTTGAVIFEGDSLVGANLRSADLRSANLCSANLCDADLCGADLCGAEIADGIKLLGGLPIISITGCGSVGRQTFAYNTDKGVYFKAGCFFGDIDAFRAKVRGDNDAKKSAQYFWFANIAAITFDKPELVEDVA